MAAGAGLAGIGIATRQRCLLHPLSVVGMGKSPPWFCCLDSVGGLLEVPHQWDVGAQQDFRMQGSH